MDNIEIAKRLDQIQNDMIHYVGEEIEHLRVSILNPQSPRPQPKIPDAQMTVDRTGYNVALEFPADIEAQLSFSETPEYRIIKPRQFLGKETFQAVASIVKRLGGEYVSAGKDTHFRIRKA